MKSVSPRWMRLIFPLASLSALGLTLAAAPAHADSQALTFNWTGQDINFGGADVTWGWSFTVTQPLAVTNLGWQDAYGASLGETHQVAIWNSVGVPVASGLVTPASTGIGSVYYSPITPTILTPGSYIIGGESGTYNGSGPVDAVVAWNVSNVTTVPGITYGQGYINPSGFAEPTTTLSAFFGGGDPGAFGPNFLVTAATPEPGSLALFATSSLGALSLLARRRRRK